MFHSQQEQTLENKITHVVELNQDKLKKKD